MIHQSLSAIWLHCLFKTVWLNEQKVIFRSAKNLISFRECALGFLLEKKMYCHLTGRSIAPHSVTQEYWGYCQKRHRQSRAVMALSQIAEACLLSQLSLQPQLFWVDPKEKIIWFKGRLMEDCFSDGLRAFALFFSTFPLCACASAPMCTCPKMAIVKDKWWAWWKWIYQ